jgi:hypothetical protein
MRTASNCPGVADEARTASPVSPALKSASWPSRTRVAAAAKGNASRSIGLPSTHALT